MLTTDIYFLQSGQQLLLHRRCCLVHVYISGLALTHVKMTHPPWITVTVKCIVCDIKHVQAKIYGTKGRQCNYLRPNK